MHGYGGGEGGGRGEQRIKMNQWGFAVKKNEID